MTRNPSMSMAIFSGCLLLIQLQPRPVLTKLATSRQETLPLHLLPRQPPVLRPAPCSPALIPGRSQSAIRQATPVI